LTEAEIIQILNLLPRHPVEVHLIIEECDQRLDEDKVQKVIDVVLSFFGEDVEENK